MNKNNEIYLEPIPGINLVNDEEKKDGESKGNQNDQSPFETSKAPQLSASTKGKKDSLDKETETKLLIFSQRMLNKGKGIDKYNKHYMLYKIHKHQVHNKDNKRNSVNFPPSSRFLQPFALIDDIDPIIEEESAKEHPISDKLIIYDENIDLNNTKKLFGYSSKNEKNPIRDGLLNRIDQLRRNQRDIDMQFNYDREIYEKKIKNLENACKANIDEAKLKKLEKKNKENKDIIKEYKKSIELAEKEKIKDNKTFSEALNSIIELKSILINELKELEVLAKKVTFQDYDEYYKENPTKIEKLNFRPKDSRYLLTNEYETSREEEESFSSYEKLNHINNTPEGFDINKRNNSLTKTEQYFNNTKNFVPTGGSGNNNSFFNHKANSSYIIKNKSNKDLDKCTLRKNETLNEYKNRSSLYDLRDSKKKNTNNTIKTNKSNFKNGNYILKSKRQDNNSNHTFNNNNNGKRLNPADFMQQDPEFFDKDKIIIPDIRKGDSFY